MKDRTIYVIFQKEQNSISLYISVLSWAVETHYGLMEMPDDKQ